MTCSFDGGAYSQYLQLSHFVSSRGFGAVQFAFRLACGHGTSTLQEFFDHARMRHWAAVEHDRKYDAHIVAVYLCPARHERMASGEVIEQLVDTIGPFDDWCIVFIPVWAVEVVVPNVYDASQARQ